MGKTLTSKDWARRNYIRLTTVKRILMFSVFIDFTSRLLSFWFHFTFGENCEQKTTNGCDKLKQKQNRSEIHILDMADFYLFVFLLCVAWT